ncbi:MAG: hypothetical protein WCL32_04120 [Planctomycetota bacterium]
MFQHARIVTLVATLLFGTFVFGQPAVVPEVRPTAPALSATEFLTAGYVKDGSVSYQRELQQAIDAAASSGRTLVFPGMIYRLDETGLALRSNLTLALEGAIFRFDDACRADGQAFLGQDVVHVNIQGGGDHGFTAGNTVVVKGYSAGNVDLNGAFTIDSATANTFTVTNPTLNTLPASFTNNTQGFAISKNTASGVIGVQRSIVASIAYTVDS